jgi:hypothetical protein
MEATKLMASVALSQVSAGGRRPETGCLDIGPIRGGMIPIKPAHCMYEFAL